MWNGDWLVGGGGGGGGGGEPAGGGGGGTFGRLMLFPDSFLPLQKEKFYVELKRQRSKSN